MKKILCVAAAFTVLFCSNAYARENNDKITVCVDEKEVEFDVQPFIENDRVLVPFRAIFEALDCEVVYYEDSKSVYAYKGDKNVSLDIDSDIMYVGDEKVKLDVPAKIVNDRTFVPVRAISEGIDACVEWKDDTKTVNIESKQGQHSVKTMKESKIYTYKDSDIVLLNVSCSYPVIENRENDEYINSLNEKFKGSFDKLISEYGTEMTEWAECEYEERLKNNETEFSPYELSETYEVTTDRNNVFSVTSMGYSNTHGAHPSSWKTSATYDLKDRKELFLDDILNMTKVEINSFVVESFDDYAQEYGETLEDLRTNIDNEKENIKFCLTDTALKLYFDVYQVGPYVMGYPEAQISYVGNEKKFKIDLGNASLDSYTVSLKGNPTTGYTWQKMQSENLLVDDYEYVPDNTDSQIVGSGGTFNFKVTALKPGKCTLEFVYCRSWEDKEPLKKSTYVFYVSKDKKITLLDCENSNVQN